VLIDEAFPSLTWFIDKNEFPSITLVSPYPFQLEIDKTLNNAS